MSDEVVRLSWNIAAGASAKGTLDCVSAWLDDFQGDLKRINVPTLVVHGDADRILPLAATGKRTHEAVKGSPTGSSPRGSHSAGAGEGTPGSYGSRTPSRRRGNSTQLHYP